MAGILAAPTIISEGDTGLALLTLLILANTAFRSLRPLPVQTSPRASLTASLELIGVTACVAATGYWDSPLTICLLAAVTVTALACPLRFSAMLTLGAALGLSIAYCQQQQFVPEALRQSLIWSSELALTSLAVSYAQRLYGSASSIAEGSATRIDALSEANALLVQLHEISQTLPASLDLDETLDTAVEQLANLFSADALALLLFDPTDGQWKTRRRRRGRPPATLALEDLPAPLATALDHRSVVRVENLLVASGPGLTPSSGSGIYAVLRARQTNVGLLALEHSDTNHFTARDAALLASFVDNTALAIDNALWFGRLRTVGADEERNRIARDLHDRIGQSLSYLAFELDRIIKEQRDASPETITALRDLRVDVRGLIGEVRDTLQDLRTDVTDAQGLIETLENYLSRVETRSALNIRLEIRETARLPMPQEREIWRIAQEAITNIERHARATDLHLLWVSDGKVFALEVRDNGIGFATTKSTRLDSYGLVGMRERAAGIGAQLFVDSTPAGGTRVRCKSVAR